ncbi:MAG TPA: DUF3459 domain-containing protein, partial [Mycobacteriales bacterium]|nr:DUF3459 domain-containing protein [Mycobacteriales bacterium]
ATRFLGYLQNHDQVGNRATGDRSSHLLSTGLLQVGAALVLLGPFVPMLFQGEEWAASAPFQYFTDHGDPALAEAVRTGRRSEFAAFGWHPEEVPDPQARETFERSRLDWAELDEEPHRTLLEWHRALIALRHATPQLRDGDLAASAVELDAGAGWLVLRRDPLEVVVNTSKSPVVVALPNGRRGVELSSAELTIRDDAVELPGESVAVLRSAS